jgi:hypothetical protein
MVASARRQVSAIISTNLVKDSKSKSERGNKAI